MVRFDIVILYGIAYAMVLSSIVQYRMKVEVGAHQYDYKPMLLTSTIFF